MVTNGLEPKMKVLYPADYVPSPVDIAGLSANMVLHYYEKVIESTLYRLPSFVLHGSVVDIDDLRQEGRLALISAAASFKPELGVSFNTYASTCVYNAIAGVLRKLDPVPEPVRHDINVLSAAEDKLHVTVEQPTVSELAAETGLSEERVKVLYQWRYRTRPTSDEGLIEHSGLSATTEDEVMLVEDGRRVREAINDLPEQTRRILLQRLLNKTPVRKLALDEGLSPARISQVTSAAVAALDKILNLG